MTFQVSSPIQADAARVLQTYENITIDADHPNQDVPMDSSISNSRDNKVLPVRKRRKSNLSQLSKRKTLGKNSSNEYSQFTSESENTKEQNTIVLSCGRTENNQPLPSVVSEAISSQPTQGSAAESEIDVDNISMLSDESSFTTTNDYSSSQNEILSDDDCTENVVGFAGRAPFQSNSNRHAALFRNNERQSNSGFINNLQVINNNFYTTSLNNVSYEGNTSANSNIPLERNGNFQRRNTKNNNSQFNNCQASSSSSSSEHGSTQHNVSMHNNLQAHRSCKNSNLIPMTYTNIASTSLPLPVSSIFTVANNSPHKYAVKNTNISNNIPVGSKEVGRANLEHRNSARLPTSGDNTNTTDENSQVTQDVSRDNDENSRQDDTKQAANASPVVDNTVEAILQENTEDPTSFDPSATNNTNVVSSQTNHPLSARLINKRKQKIQNANFFLSPIQSSYNINPSTSALCKTNSFSLCNYIQNNQATSKCNLVKFNANQTGVKQGINSENEGILNNVQTQPNTQYTGPVSVVTTNDNNTASSSDNTTRHQVTSPTMIQDTRDDSYANNRQELIQPANSDERNTITPMIISESACSSEGTTSQSHSNNVCSSSKTQQTNCISNSNGLEVNSSYESISTNAATTVDLPNTHPTDLEVDNNDLSEANPFQCASHNIPNTMNNLNNNATNNVPATTHNICSLTNNLHKNKKSNLNQLGRRNVGKEEKVFTAGKDISTQPNTSTSDANTSGSYQVINNSIERNFNKLNTCSQEINAHKNVKSTKDKNKRHKKAGRRPQSEQFEGIRCNNEDLNSTRITNTQASSSISITTSISSHVEHSDNVTTSDSMTPPASSSANDINPTTSANVFQDMNNTIAIQSNQGKSLFNNENHPTNKMDKTDKNISNVFNKKELVNITRNNFNLTQDHSNVRRSNSLNVKINDLASGTQLSNDKNSIRKSITKSNSFTIRNNICEAGTSQNYTEDSRHFSKNLKNNVNKTAESNQTVHISSERASNAFVRDNLEEFRLEEASNDVRDVASFSGENNLSNENSENQNDGGLILNNCMDNTENYPSGSQYKPGSSSSGGAGGSNPQMIHNNIEPRCKKNKKCNEERGPLKPINSENKPKPNDQ